MRSPMRWAVLAVVLVAAVVVALTVPLPTPLELRERAQSLGPWAPALFLLAHAVITTTPLPRTAFTLSAGVLFGPVLGLGLCLLGSTTSALVAFHVARRLGGRAVERLGPGRVRALERRLSDRGLLTVLSTRLVPAIPFAPLNYTFGVTSVSWRPYLLGTMIGLVPGTAAVVVLGDAATGSTSPAGLIVFAVSGSLGLAGVLWSARRQSGEPALSPRAADDDDPADHPPDRPPPP